ncbi:MAG: serine/threonine protein kinase [Myxococcales bacterium]|nr:serine/threonine protein kinase [Myxococcales bacterium]
MTEAPRSLLTVKEVARGGLGIVELALRREGRFERLCAVKRPHPHLLHSPDAVEMFLEEGRLAGLLQHPHVVPVLDVGKDERGPFLLMDFIEGVSLAELVKSAQRERGALPVSVVVQIARQAAEGLRAAHELVGVDGAVTPLIHRDISPQNLLVGYDGAVRVLDFGIAKLLRSDAPETRTGLKGKCGYMAPEQLRFEPVDPRTDLFALGVVLFEALTTTRLYRGDLETAARLILHGPPPDVRDHRPNVDPTLARLVGDMLAKHRDDRVPSAKAVIDRLREIERRLRLSPDWIDLGAFMEGSFATRRDDERASRAWDVARAERRDVTGSTGATGPTGPTLDPVRERASLRAPLALGAALAIVLGVVGGLAWSPDDAPPASEATPPRPTASDATPPRPTASDATPREPGADQPRSAATTPTMPASALPSPSAAAPPPESDEDEAITLTPARREPRRTRSTRSSTRMGLAGEFWD